MATRAEQIMRHQLAEEAKQRIKNGVYSQPQSAQVNPRTEAIRNYYVEDNPVSELRKAVPSSLQALNPITNSTLMGAVNGNPSAQKTYKQYTGIDVAPVQGPIFQPPTEYNAAKADIQSSGAPGFVKGYANVMNELVNGNPVGRFFNRIGRSADSVIGTPATIDTSTGNKVADKTADIIGSFAGLAAPISPGVPGANLTTGPVQIAEGAIANRAGQATVGALGRGLERAGVNAGTANRIAQNTVVGAGAGAIGNAAASVMQGNSSLPQVAESAALGAAFGGGLGAAGTAVGEAIGRRTAAVRRQMETRQPNEPVAPEVQTPPAARGLNEQEFTVNPDAEPILRPSQFDNTNGVGISAFSKTKPYQSLSNDTRSQLVTRQQKDPVSLKGTSARLYTKLVDDLYPLQQQDNLVEKIIGDALPAGEQIHTLGLASRGADVIAKRIITDGLVDSQGNVVGDSLKSILKGLPAKKKDIYVDFEDYLINKHALTRAARDETVFDKKLNWTPEYGAQKVAEYEQMFPEFKNTADRLYSFQRDLVNKWLVEPGIISPEQAQAWFDANPYYVPNKRQFTNLEKGSGGFTRSKQGFGNQSVPVKKYGKGGSQRKIISPIESIIENVDAFVKTAKRNQVMQQYVRNIERDPEAFADWAEIVKQPEKPEDITKMLMDSDGLDELLSRFSEDFNSSIQKTKLDKDNIVRVLVNGEPVHVKIKDKQLLDAVTALGPEQGNWLIDAVGQLTNMTKTLTTGANPVFSLTRNIFRDIPQAYIASKSTNNPLRFASDLVSAAIDVGRNRGAYRDFLNVGGGHASPIAANRNLLAQSKSAVLPQGIARGIVPRAYHGLENLMNAVEAAPRLAEFKRVRNNTGDLQKALYEAQDLTVNFKRRGSLTRTIDKVFPYFNAAIQGLDQVTRVYKDAPWKALVKSALALSFPSMALYALNYDNPDYQKLNNRTKDAFFLIPKGDGTFIKIAKPQEQGTVFTDIPERLMRMFYEQDPTAFRDFADRLRTTFFPPGIQGLFNGEDPLSGLLNDTIAGPAVQTVSNKSWNGSPIVPGYLERLSPGLQSDARTSKLATKIGETVDYSPKKIDYLIQQYSGVLGQIGLPLLSPGGDLGYSLKSQVTADPVFSNDASTEFYHYKDKLDQAKTDNGAGKKLPKWYNDNTRKQFNRISDQMGDIRKKVRAVQGDNKLSNEQKRTQLRTLQDQINALAQKGNELAKGKIPY